MTKQLKPTKRSKILKRIARMPAEEFKARLNNPKFIAKLEAAGIKVK